jgi:hypothetical protein
MRVAAREGGRRPSRLSTKASTQRRDPLLTPSVASSVACAAPTGPPVGINETSNFATTLSSILLSTHLYFIPFLSHRRRRSLSKHQQHYLRQLASVLCLALLYVTFFFWIRKCPCGNSVAQRHTPCPSPHALLPMPYIWFHHCPTTLSRQRQKGQWPQGHYTQPMSEPPHLALPPSRGYIWCLGAEGGRALDLRGGVRVNPAIRQTSYLSGTGY